MLSKFKPVFLKRAFSPLLGLLVVGLLSFSILHAAPQLPSKNHPHCFYSNQCRDDLTAVFKNAIRKSKKSIYLAIYALTETTLIDELNSSAESGIEIFILYDHKASPGLAKKLHANIKTSPYKGQGLMHRKILVIDHKMVLLGTANFTPTSLKYHGNLVTGIYSPPLATCLESSGKRQCDCILPLGKVALELLPDRYDQSLNKLIECIRLSQKTCYVAMYTFTHPRLTKELIDAHNRGIDVRVVIDGTSYQGASYSTYLQLKEARVPVFHSLGPELMHHKWVWIDKKNLVVGSTNWTRAAFKKNHDCFLILKDLDLESQKKLDSLWNILEVEAR